MVKYATFGGAVPVGMVPPLVLFQRDVPVFEIGVGA